jgi:hypothetical protein
MTGIAQKYGKVLRKIYGPVCENGEWRIQTNTELMELYDELDVTEVKRMRLRWVGHMERMLDDRNTEKLCSNKPEDFKTGEKVEVALVR